MVDTAVVSRKLSQIEQYYSELQAKQDLSKETFLGEVTERRAVERMFENAIQACIDLSKHIATEAFGYTSDESREAVEILGEHDVLDDGTVATMTDAVGFRNILAHEYGDVNPGLVYDYLQNELELYAEFSRQIAIWFDRRES